jgi:hypothetical protein
VFDESDFHDLHSFPYPDLESMFSDPVVQPLVSVFSFSFWYTTSPVAFSCATRGA